MNLRVNFQIHGFFSILLSAEVALQDTQEADQAAQAVKNDEQGLKKAKETLSACQSQKQK